MPNESFLLISIGPIQDFIASARKCQDLWAGSVLLSELARDISRALAKDAGGSALMIFPAKDKINDEKIAVANKIAAIVPTEKAEALGEQAEKNLREFLAERAGDIFDTIKSTEFAKYFDEDRALNQIGEMMECFWVSVPCASRKGKDYQEARQRAEYLLAARKATRDWTPTRTWAASIPKSSIDGLRETVIKESLYNVLKSERPKDLHRARRVLGIKKHEYLCGVGVLKRKLEEAIETKTGSHYYRKVFHSTSHTATKVLLPFFERVDIKQAFDDYLDTLSGGDRSRLNSHVLKEGGGFQGSKDQKHYDGYLLYPSRLDDILDEIYSKASKDLKENVEKKLRVLLKKMNLSEPPAYFALLQADGDHMGKLIDAQKSAADHAKLSAALDGFSTRVADIVEDHYGSLIYSGGDDVLALIPMHQAVPCAKALEESFRKHLAAYGTQTYKPSLSVGLAFVHHMLDFSEARALAKEAEKLAKTQRDALGVIYDKRSGGRRSFVGSWSYNPPIDQRLEDWISIIANGEMSHGFLREIEELSRIAKDWGKAQHEDEKKSMESVLKYELKRIVAQKIYTGSMSEKLKDDVETILEAFSKRQKNPPSSLEENLDQLGTEFFVALELHRINQMREGA